MLVWARRSEGGHGWDPGRCTCCGRRGRGRQGRVFCEENKNETGELVRVTPAGNVAQTHGGIVGAAHRHQQMLRRGFLNIRFAAPVAIISVETDV